MLNNPVLDRIVLFFEADVLNLYISHPDKYELDTDSFDGVLETTEAYFNELKSSGRLDKNISIRFGYCSKTDGTLCIAVNRSDFEKAPEMEQRKWNPFIIVEKSLLSKEDDFFKKWYEIYIEGSWSIEDGPKKRLAFIIEKINACCKTLVNEPLYTAIPNQSILFPISQNSHAYEDAHKNLYGFLVDSLSRKCLMNFASLRSKTIKDAAQMRLPNLMKHVFNEFDKQSKLQTLLAKVSEQRGGSSHGNRPPATTSDAFRDFYQDLEVATQAYEELLKFIESEFSVSSGHELNRDKIMTDLPKIAGDVKPKDSIRKASKMTGKTVEKVWFGMREDKKGSHQSDVLYFQFTDGEILAIDTCSNALDILAGTVTKQNELDVNLNLTWVPAPSNKK